MEDNTAKGVWYDSPYGEGKVMANREVILSGGAINSPMLLMLSGIGPKEHLEEFDIECLQDLPAVGENLQDQVLVPLSYTTKHSSQSLDNTLFSFKNVSLPLL